MLINGISTNASARAGQVHMLNEALKVKATTDRVLNQIKLRLEVAQSLDNSEKNVEWHDDYLPTSMLFPMKVSKTQTNKEGKTVNITLTRPEIADMLLSPKLLKEKQGGIEFNENVQIALL